jgi:P-type Ca2+ transporter type 2C
MKIDQKYPYHTISSKEALEKLSSTGEGLTSEEVAKRQEEYGKNVLPQKGGASPFKLFIKQFKDFLVIILMLAAVIAFLADQMADVYLILAVIIFNAAMGFIQEYKAEKAIDAIKSLIQKNASVFRDGKKKELPAEECVPGDIILLEEGQSIPADARLLSLKGLRTSEAPLTGESMPIEKNTDPVEDENEPLGDRLCMIFKGTNVAQGSGKAVVTATGEHTEIGKIATSMSTMKMQDSNFRRKTGELGKQMAVIAIVTSIIVFAFGFWYRGMEFEDILLVTIATLVSTIPEGLPAVISIVLAIGANRMAKKNVIIREFTATEMMGSVSVILSDKTGTITKSILTVKKIFTGSNKEMEVTGDGYHFEGEFKIDNKPVDLKDQPVERKLLAIAAFSNNAYLNEKTDSQDE